MAEESKKASAQALPQHLPFLTLILLLLIAFYSLHGPVRSWLSGRHRAVATFDRAMGIVLEEYVDARMPQELVHGAIRGMVYSLKDPHSAFLSPRGNQRQEEIERGRYVGLGILIQMQDQEKHRGIVILQVFEGSPAEGAGLLAGDVILSATEVDPKHITPATKHDLTGTATIQEASDVLRGKPGSRVALGILRDGKELEITVERREVQRPLVKSRMVADGIGYLRISDFPDHVHEKAAAALQELEGKGLRGLVLDLMGNSGGFLDEAVRVADLFIAEGVIVSTRSRHERDNRIYSAKPGGPAEDLPLMVLINGATASAAEVVAGALQDYGRARLVGTKSYGKGAVNKRFPLPDDSGILLTTGKYFLPKGRQIEGKGLKPDVEVQPPTAEDLKKVKPGEEPPNPARDAAVKLLLEQLGKTLGE